MKKLFQIMLAIVAIVTMAIGLTACGIVKGDGTLGVKATQLATPTGLRIDGGNLCWNPVEYASQYTVSIDGAEYYCTDYKYSLEGVKDGEHVFNVKANGDGVLYTSSAFSAELRVELEGSAPVSRGYYGQFDELTKNESFLGYGFDVINSSVFSDKYIKTSFPLFDNEKLMQQRLVKVDSKHSYIDEIESSDMEKFVQQWNVNANVNVSWGKKRIGGSVGVEAAYSGGVENAKSKYFHCISITNQKFYIVLQSDIDTYKSMVKDSFANDLYSDMEPAELFNLYGTHFITSAVMGGKINSYYLYSSSEEKTYHDFSSTVSTEVRYMIGKTNVEVSGGYRQEFEKKNVYVKNTLDVIGGSDLGMLSDADIPANYKEWEKSLNDHASLMGIKDSSSLIPIWKLIDASKDTRTYTWDYSDVYKNAQKDKKDEEIVIPDNAIGSGNRAAQLQAYFNAYGFDSYNALMEAAGLPTIKVPESIENVRINNLTSDNDEYEVYAGSSNDIGFTVSPADATGYTKTADISGNYPYARITNEKGVLALEIDSDAPVGEVLDIILSAGSVRKTIKVVIQKNYVVKFNSNGGTPVDSITVVHNGQIDEPEKPKKEGYIFAGWYTDADFVEESKFKFGRQAITKNMTLYAKWDTFCPTISFSSDIVGGALESVKVNYNEVFARPSNPTLEGYTFDNFYANKQLTIPFDFSKSITKDTIIYIKWFTNPTISYVSNIDIGTLESVRVIYNTIPNRPANPVLEGYTFDDFYANKELTILFDFSQAITKDTTIYLKWNINSYTVTFDPNGGSIVSGKNQVTVKYNSLIEAPVCSKVGAEFAGWYIDPDRTVLFDFANDKVKGNMTLYAKWANNLLTVKFDSGCDIKIDDRKINYNTTLGVNFPSVDREGYKLIGWYKEESFKNKVTDATIFNESNFKDLSTEKVTTLYAKWSPITYTVSYNPNGGTGTMTDNELSYDEKIQLNENTFVKTGCRFIGWAKSADGDVLYGDKATVKNLTTADGAIVYLFAKWEKVDYRISYEFNGGVKIDGGNYPVDYYNIEEDCTISDLQYSSYPEYNHFLGWYEDAEFTKPFANDLNENPRDIELFAKWDLVICYNTLEETPKISAIGDRNRVIIDWSGYPAGTYNYSAAIDPDGDNVRNEGGNTNLEVSNSITEIYFIGNSRVTFTGLSIVLCLFDDGQTLNLKFKDFKFQGTSNTIWGYECKNFNLNMEFIGDNEISSNSGSALSQLANTEITGSGNLSISGANGGNGGQYAAGGDGQVAISVNVLIINTSGTMTIKGGNGGNGGNTSSDTGRANSLRTAGSGGNGADAISCTSCTIIGNVAIKAGNGGNGGYGYKTKNNAGIGGNGGNGGHGIRYSNTYSVSNSVSSSGGSAGAGGNAQKWNVWGGDQKKGSNGGEGSAYYKS